MVDIGQQYSNLFIKMLDIIYISLVLWGIRRFEIQIIINSISVLRIFNPNIIQNKPGYNIFFGLVFGLANAINHY